MKGTSTFGHSTSSDNITSFALEVLVVWLPDYMAVRHIYLNDLIASP